MDFDADVIDISPMDHKKGFKSTNFGDGIELLMNEKVRDNRSSSGSSDIHLDDLNNLENELNELSGQGGISFQPKSDIFSFKREERSARFEEEPLSGGGGADSFGEPLSFSQPISIGQSTAESGGGATDSKTWDGFGKFNNIPMNPDQAGPSGPNMSKEDLLREKFKYLRKLESLEKKGIELSKKYNMESSLSEMQGEYQTIVDEKAKESSVKFQGQMLMSIINMLEYLNHTYDPCDLKLDGWGEQINENITEYDEIFAELYDRYKDRARMHPALKLLFQLGGSGIMVHMSNTLFKSAMPGMDDILRQNPDLMRQFQNAAVNSMAQNNPGFGNFMSGVMNPEPMVPPGRGPPPPMATQAMEPPSRSRGGNNSLGNGGGYSSEMNLNMTRPDFSDRGMNMRPIPEKAERSRRPVHMPRAEMKGPNDISDILSGLKTKTINIQEARPPTQSPPDNNNNNHNNDSTISISDLKDLQGGNLPKRSRRRKSDKNTISLDI